MIGRGRLAALILLPACQLAPGSTPLPAADADGYSRELHATAEASCATLDCHGDEGRPLRLYAETGLREGDELRGAPITPAELEANALALVAIDPAPPDLDRHLLLMKPLARSAGGMQHEGGEIWPSRDHAAYRCFRAWLAGSVDDAAADCAAAREEVALPP